MLGQLLMAQDRWLAPLCGRHHGQGHLPCFLCTCTLTLPSSLFPLHLAHATVQKTPPPPPPPPVPPSPNKKTTSLRSSFLNLSATSHLQPFTFCWCVSHHAEDYIPSAKNTWCTMMEMEENTLLKDNFIHFLRVYQLIHLFLRLLLKSYSVCIN